MAGDFVQIWWSTLAPVRSSMNLGINLHDPRLRAMITESEIDTSMDLGLSRITRLIREHQKILPWKAIHIAGTNGKGSTSAFLSGLLHCSGTSVGRFNSPHLIHRHDCININEKTIDKNLFDQIEAEVKQRNENIGAHATAFELLTAIAFEAFARTKVDIGVVECGLGGARDATNVLAPQEVLCSVITTLAMDHADVLGNTIEDIAREKAGIMKKDVPVVVVAESKSDVSKILQQAAEQAGSRLFRSMPFARSIGKHLTNKDAESKQHLAKAMDIPTFQLRNLALAYDAFMIARQANPKRGRYLNPNDVMDVATRVRKTWRGRLEWASVAEFTGRRTPILVDGAHNPQAAKLLRKYVDQHYHGGVKRRVRPVTWVIAMTSTKDVREILNKLIKPPDRVILTQFGPVDGMPWVTPASLKTLEEAVQGLTTRKENVRLSPTPGEALRAAVNMTQEDWAVVVAGSLYLVGDILRIPAVSTFNAPE